MDIFLITFQAVATLLGIGILGFWIIGQHRASGDTLGFLSALSIDVAVPCLVLASLIIDFSSRTNPDWWHMPLWWLAFLVISLALALLCSLAARRDFRGEFAMGLFFQNGLFFPLIIITGLFGTENPYFVPLFLLIFLHPTLMFSTYPLFFPGKQASRVFSMARVFNPVLVSTIVGMAIALIGFQSYVPQFVKTILIMVGAMASPLFMLILGGSLYHDLMMERGGKRNIYWGEVVKFCLAKNFVFPLAMLGILILVKPSFPVALILMLEAAVPPVTAIPIFAERSGANRNLAGQFIVGSFLASLFSIPMALYFFNIFFPFPP
ncbi:MAG: AEC family transporter [Syntrophales bacterium]|jgi:predicted permease|nr:AEC family transporter [Syntrophales bacterium]